MSIQSLGVGSGLDLEGLVSQLLQAERAPKTQRLNTREAEIESTISGLGLLKSKMSDFEDVLDSLKEASNLASRLPSVNEVDEEFPTLEATASSSALEGVYDITVERLASGSRIETDDGEFATADATVLTAGTGQLTFGSASDTDTFTIDVAAGMTLTELREAINQHADNFGVSANIIDTGRAEGAKLVFTSNKTGAGNDLVIKNASDTPELDRLSTTDSTATNTYLTPVKIAENALAIVDGIEVESATNEFEETIQNVTFTVSNLSPFASDGITRRATELTIGLDKEALRETMDEFIESYNSLITEIDSLTKYGETDLDKDGALAGDSLARGIRQNLATIVGNSVPGNDIGGLFAMGIELTSDGLLEISTNDFGLGSGSDRLDDALDDNFDAIASLFSDETDGVASRLLAYVEQFTSSSGLISSRESAAEDDQDNINDARATLELRMASYESVLRDRYLNLDQTVARLNQTSSALLASLG